MPPGLGVLEYGNDMNDNSDKNIMKCICRAMGGVLSTFWGNPKGGKPQRLPKMASSSLSPSSPVARRTSSMCNDTPTNFPTLQPFGFIFRISIFAFLAAVPASWTFSSKYTLHSSAISNCRLRLAVPVTPQDKMVTPAPHHIAQQQKYIHSCIEHGGK